ncbi:hypothetical protein FHR24_002736 [Wenyingzhuangia heitensis]|uniref:Secretion system C-terminal sorting domain-containing protein n=1 Tax=Wenyingzhuangia heitensis TaxID=1487859 RepID=A0ABX0UBR2_9FLAO|nr:T9SS type A sorting domain-containing protein [Wenyingzhuangia heitensis]NIJ46252.1 hypothetical protein [Wenyingzhuangia heitensis]
MKTYLLNVRITFFMFLTGLLLSFQNTHAQTSLTADTASEIISMINDTSIDTLKIKAGTYLFTAPIDITRSNLVVIGLGDARTNTVLKLSAESKGLIRAYGENIKMVNLTLNANNYLKAYDNSIFVFSPTKDSNDNVTKVSKNHKFDNVLFKKSNQKGIAGPAGFATHGLEVLNSQFEGIADICILILNRNTAKRGKVITTVDKFVVDNCIFKTGYERGVIADCGNDRETTGVVDGKDVGTRITTSTSLNGSTVKNCTFEKAASFHIGGVQISDYNIRHNQFDGMSGTEGYGQAIHFEQFVRNVEIYNNSFSMNPTGTSTYQYISLAGTEGHKRVSQQEASNTYPSWTYWIDGGSERRAYTDCISEADQTTTSYKYDDVNFAPGKDCKRDVHDYGPRQIYIAGNTFNSSTSLSSFISIDEGEQIFIGARRDESNVDNTFLGSTVNNKDNAKIFLEGYDEGTCNAWIKNGQGITSSEIYEPTHDVYTSLCREVLVDGSNVNKNRKAASSISGDAFSRLSIANVKMTEEILKYNSSLNTFQNTVISPNPANDVITITNNSAIQNITITNVSGTILKDNSYGGEKNISISIHNLHPGMYLVIITGTDGSKVIKKLIKN